MGRSSQYTHEIQRLNTDGSVGSPIWDDIEERYDGLLYEKMEGIFDVGKAKNIYTETYADDDRVRSYFPPDGVVTNESTTVNLYVLIVGDQAQRLATLDAFMTELRSGVHRYRDDARCRMFDFIVVDEASVSDERWHGSMPYVEVKIPMMNLNGKTTPYQPASLPSS